MSNNLSGISSLAYQGTNAGSPANVTTHRTDPNPNITQNFSLGDIWLNTVTNTIWQLVSLSGNVATWVRVSDGGGTVTDIMAGDGNLVSPLAGVITFPNGSNINTVGSTPNNLIINLTNTVSISGSFTAGTGITSTTGNIVATAGQVNAGTTMTAGTGITSTTGNIIASAGNINATVGSMSAGTTLTAGTGITSTTGNISALFGNFVGQSVSLDTTASSLSFVKARGAGPIQTGDGLGSLIFSGFDGSSTTIGAAIQSTSSGTIAANRVAGNLQFFTHPDAATALTERMVIAPTGEVTINTPDSGVGLTITAGGLTVTAGNIVATAGNISATAGSLSAGTTVTGGTGVTATTGDIVATAGNITVPTTSATAGSFVINGNRFVHAYGTDNTFVGEGSGNVTLTTLNATNNSGYGRFSLNALTTGADNCSYGDLSSTDIESGSSNCSFGSGSLSSLVSGSRNIAIGFNAASAYTTSESSNIIIGNAGVVTESNVIRIGTSGGGAGQQNKCWIAGIVGVTTDVNDAIPVLIDSTGQLGTVSSSLKYKKDINPIDYESEAIYDLNPITFRYKSNNSEHYGLIAEEVEKVLPSLVIYKDEEPDTIKYHELPILMLNEIQRLRALISDLEERVNDLEMQEPCPEVN